MWVFEVLEIIYQHHTGTMIDEETTLAWNYITFFLPTSSPAIIPTALCPLQTTSVHQFQARVVSSSTIMPIPSHTEFFHITQTHTHYFSLLGSSSSCVEQRSALPLRTSIVPLACQCSTHHLHLEWYLYVQLYSIGYIVTVYTIPT